MDAKTKKGLIASGVAIAIVGAVYFIFRKPKSKKDNNDIVNPIIFPDNAFDAYSMVDKATKIQEIREYLKANATELQKSAYSLGLDPIWTFADTYAKGTNEGIIAWYAAIKKNQPTFTFYNKVILKNENIDTKTGNKV